MHYRFLKLFIILLGIVLLMGCEYEEMKPQRYAERIETEYYNYKKICLEGVSYWKGYKFLAPVYKQNGSLELCEEN